MTPAHSHAATPPHSLRIAFIAEIFPSKSETWVHHEIDALKRMGCTVQVFATHAKPENIPSELIHFVALTTYLPELCAEWRSCFKTLSEPSLLKPVLAGLIGDCSGVRRRAQVIRDLFYVSILTPAISHFQPDILYSHFAGTRSNIALFYSLISKVPFVIKLHAGDIFNRVALFRLKSANAASMLTISGYNINFIRSHYPDVNASCFEQHACGILLPEFPFQPVYAVHGMPMILAVGRLVRMKGFDVLLRASRILLDEGFQHRVVIIGDGPEWPRLERLRSRLNLDEVVDLKGYVSPTGVRTELSTATVFALPAVWDSAAKTQDGIPVSLMEAMALGVLVVSTTTSGIPELIQDGVSGLLAGPNDPAALAQKIRFGCEIGGVARLEMLRMARKKVEADHDAEKLTAQLLNIFEGITCAG
ncbi:MAG: glycosyltransferase [Rhodocyclales bacterium]|nr:glycosyltransferase [Rhodocyclales bacterium]